VFHNPPFSLGVQAIPKKAVIDHLAVEIEFDATKISSDQIKRGIKAFYGVLDIREKDFNAQ
jgi:hypothetical protein